MKPKSKIASFFDNLFVNFHEIRIISKIERVVQKMNPAEKLIFIFFSVLTVISGLVLLIRVHNYFLIEVPKFGGTLIEGSLGSPRFINPVFAISDTDKTLTNLVYSGLLKIDEKGNYSKELAESYEITDDGRIYNFTLRSDAYFHDGKPVTSDDIVFTINKILDPVIKSSKQSNWTGVTVEKIDEKNIRFILSKPYAPFLESLTIGILPKHIWEKASSEEFAFSGFNINAIGSGPYRIKKVERNGGGILTSITLESSDNYINARPKIKLLILKFFQNENSLFQSLKDRTVESAVGLSPNLAKNLKNEKNLNSDILLPRVFGLFLNQNVAPLFLNKEIREALVLSAPKKRIIDEVLFGFGKAIDGPTPLDIQTENIEGDLEKARLILENNGWKKNENGLLEKETKSGKIPFSFSITTSDSADLKNTANILKETWEKLGASVEIKIFEASDLSQNVIKTRKYDALLFGEIINEKTDLYPFWHSSERNDPGLNIALYANITVDKALEELRTDLNYEKSLEKKEIIKNEIKKDLPVIFLFSPSLTYLKSEKVKNISLKNISTPSERFVSINKWFIETDKVLRIFAK
jgi:peptide/nickel transport system substrate-binding protein